jgi:hypothetical protein
MKIISFTALHYGRSYLGYALKSVLSYVDECWILYSAIGSHGFRTSIPCPETRDELYVIAHAVAGDKLRWYESEWSTEGDQRDAIYELVPDADIIYVLDADEIWNKALLEVHTGFYANCVEHGFLPPQGLQRIPIIHFWRSFYRCVLHDPSYPIRVIYPKAPRIEGSNSVETYRDDWGWGGHPCISHMGYAQPSNIVNYKQLTHGHRGQWRTDCNWFQDKFMANAQVDCHPVGSQYWQPEVIDPWQYLPAFMKAHPFAQMDVIP